jgi:hypothetical protein
MGLLITTQQTVRASLEVLVERALHHAVTNAAHRKHCVVSSKMPLKYRMSASNAVRTVSVQQRD